MRGRISGAHRQCRCRPDLFLYSGQLGPPKKIHIDLRIRYKKTYLFPTLVLTVCQIMIMVE